MISITGTPFEERSVPPLPQILICCFFRVWVVVAQMANNNGKLSWGPCIDTTGNRVCDPQGQFNHEGSEFEQATYPDLVRLEDNRARANSVLMTVPLDQIIELCTFNGDLDKIARRSRSQATFANRMSTKRPTK